jgi:cephalosporin-C deacetylase-like acetyl esterase
MLLQRRAVHTAWIVAALLSLALSARPARSQFDPQTISVSTERMDAFFAREAERVTSEAWARIDTREKIEKEREALLREFRFMIGLEPLPERTPLNLTVVRTVDRPEYTVEVLYFQSLPGFYVTASLYRPKKGRAPYPAVVWGPGHSADESGAKALCQSYAIPWVRSGYICLMIDPIQVAEVFGFHRGMHSRSCYDWLSRGYTPIGIEVWNAMRGVDYLLTRKDVDGTKLTVNGVSGGGHLSWMAGAADNRFAVVQPIAATGTIEAHVKLDLQRMACDCAYFINAYRQDWTTLAALVSPRPLLLGCSTGDSYYPPQGYEKVFERVKSIYSFFGVPDKATICVVPGPHDYTSAQRVKAVEWSNRWLTGKQAKAKDTAFDTIPGPQLAALGGMHGSHPENINNRIQDLLIPAARLETYNDLTAWERKRGEVMGQLNSVVFRNMPRPVRWKVAQKGEHNAVALETEQGIQVGVISYVPESEGPKQSAILYIASPGDTEDMGIWNFMKAYPFKGYAASRHMIFPRGIGTQIWNGNDRRKFERDAMLIGRTVDEMRLYDVLCAIDYLASQPWFNGKEFTVAGMGAAGIIGAYAALLDPRVTRVILKDPPLSHTEAPFFLNVLRYTDIPQVLALLAPRELDFLTGQYDSFGYTRAIYGLYGAEKKFRRAYTIPEILNLKE